MMCAICKRRKLAVGVMLVCLLAYPFTLNAQLRDALAVTAVAFPADDAQVVIGAGDGRLELWNISPEMRLRSLGKQRGKIRVLTMSGNGTRAFSTDDENALMLWDLTSGKGSRVHIDDLGEVKAATLSADGKLLVISDNAKAIHAVDAPSGKLLWSSRSRPKVTAALQLSPNGRLLMVIDIHGLPALYDTQTRKLACGANLFSGALPYSNAVAFSQDGARLLVADGDFNIGVFDVAACKLIGTFKGHRNFITALAISRDGKQAVSAGYEAVLTVWDLAARKAIRAIPTPLDETGAVALSPDARRVTVMLGPRIVRWELPTGKEMPLVLPLAAPTAQEKKVIVQSPVASTAASTGTRRHTASSGKFSVALPSGWHQRGLENGIEIEAPHGIEPVYKARIKISYFDSQQKNSLWRSAERFMRLHARPLFGLGNHVGNEYGQIESVTVGGVQARTFAKRVIELVPVHGFNSLPMKPGVVYEGERVAAKHKKFLTWQKYVVVPVKGGFYAIEYKALSKDAAEHIAEFDAVVASFRLVAN